MGQETLNLFPNEQALEAIYQWSTFAPQDTSQTYSYNSSQLA